MSRLSLDRGHRCYLSQSEDDCAEPGDDVERVQTPLWKRLSELEVCKKGSIDDDEKDLKRLPPNRHQPGGPDLESSNDEVDEDTRKALYVSSAQRARDITKSSLTVEEALAPGGPLSEDS